MIIEDPRVNPVLLPEGSRAVVIADNQEEFLSLPSVRTPGGQVVTRWGLTDDERRAVFEGTPVFVTLLSPGPIAPMMVSVGPKNWKASEPQLRSRAATVLGKAHISIVVTGTDGRVHRTAALFDEALSGTNVMRDVVIPMLARLEHGGAIGKDGKG